MKTKSVLCFMVWHTEVILMVLFWLSFCMVQCIDANSCTLQLSVNAGYKCLLCWYAFMWVIVNFISNENVHITLSSVWSLDASRHAHKHLVRTNPLCLAVWALSLHLACRAATIIKEGRIWVEWSLLITLPCVFYIRVCVCVCVCV